MKPSLILAGATLALTSAVAAAQTTAKPSPYEGVAQPPASDVIRATEAPAAAPPPAATTVPAPMPSPAAAPVKQAPAATTTPANPDYGIIETPVNADAGLGANTPALKSHNGQTYNPDADIVASVPTPANALAAGTPIHTHLNNALISSENGAGTRFSAQVDQDVVQNSRVIIPTAA